eukprot:4107910-Lingulodinium_polyedra.AAC.1
MLAPGCAALSLGRHHRARLAGILKGEWASLWPRGMGGTSAARALPSSAATRMPAGWATTSWPRS